jgi:UDP-N-acetylmuramoylalanine--D-glutamate ligase
MRDKSTFSGMKVTVMGLGLHGGGMESARYLVARGAEVTVTDLRDEKVLAPSIEKLKGYTIRYVLGKHEMENFTNADMVIKNPGVKLDSPYLKAAKKVETDISLFLAACPARILAVTGTKGKSSTTSALYHVLKEAVEAQNLAGKAWLGGNITCSPLSFLDELDEKDTVALELSSWQLGDIRGRNLLKPRAAVLTPIMRDHLDRYGTMEVYVADKRLIYADQDSNGVTVAADDDWGRSFHKESRGRPLVYSGKPLSENIPGGWISGPEAPAFARLWEIPGGKGLPQGNNEPNSIVEIVPARLLVPGVHQKQNLLAAALALLDLGIKPDLIRESLGRFPGVEHRLEFFHESGGVKFYNDSAATIPEAAAAAIAAFEKPPILVAGGADKELDFSPLAKAAGNAKALILLAGTGTKKLKNLLDDGGVKYRGPFDSLEPAINAVLEHTTPGDCTSFGMFHNEVDRGQKWKEGVKKLAP